VRTGTYIFRDKIHLFVTPKSDMDPDTDPHWFGSLDPDPDLNSRRVKSWIRIRIETNADPKQCTGIQFSG
jgi:hypothetical protein